MDWNLFIEGDQTINRGLRETAKLTHKLKDEMSGTNKGYSNI